MPLDRCHQHMIRASGEPEASQLQSSAATSSLLIPQYMHDSRCTAARAVPLVSYTREQRILSLNHTAEPHQIHHRSPHAEQVGGVLDWLRTTGLDQPVSPLTLSLICGDRSGSDHSPGKERTARHPKWVESDSMPSGKNLKPPGV